MKWWIIVDLQEAIRYIERHIPDPKAGLPEKVFLFASRIVPMVNVDLLVKNEIGQTLLSWRDDQYAGKGWHIPGGIIRFKEKLATRIVKVAETEIGISLTCRPQPIAVNQVIVEHADRGHFISLLYECFIPSTFKPANKNLTITSTGFLKWFDRCPENLVSVHEMYREYI